MEDCNLSTAASDGPQRDPDELWSEQFLEELQQSRRETQDLLGAQLTQIEGLQASLTGELEAVEAARRLAQREQTIREEEIADAREQCSRLQQRLKEQLLRLEADREELAARQARTRSQRRRIALELKERRAAQREQIERRKAELHSTAARRQTDHSAALEAAEAAAAELRLEVGQLRKLLAERSSELAQLREELHNADAASNDHARQLARVRTERDQLRARLTEAEQGHAEKGSEADRQKLEDFQRRFELAVSELRELKGRNAELEEQLAAAPTANGVARTAGEGGRLDWESQKRRLLETLENDPDDDDRDDVRLTIEGTIRITDAVVAQKDREIAELKELLNHQSTNLGAMAVGAAAIGELLNTDELIQQQRERLTNLQTEWEEKLRQAEIEISRERAKLARDRAELEEKQLRVQQTQQAQSDAAPAAKPGSPADPKAKTGRWLARLGLKDPPGE